MKVNNLICETLDPKNPIAKLYTTNMDDVKRVAFIKNLNYAVKTNNYNLYKHIIKI